jgi:hypothetical protein
MAKDQHGWVRSYRQAIEMLIRLDADTESVSGILPETRARADAYIGLVGKLWQVGRDELFGDITEFRRDQPAWVERMRANR